MNNILFVNHKQERCGVHQYGVLTEKLLRHSQKYNFVFPKVDGLSELEDQMSAYRPQVVIYNYHSSTMPWLNDTTYPRYKYAKHLVIHHEPHQEVPRGYDAIISQDPWTEESDQLFHALRPIPSLADGDIEELYTTPNPIPRIGSFGFGMAGKGFDRLVKKVCDEFAEAVVCLHIPFAFYGDNSGTQAQGWAELARRAATNPGVQVDIDHTWFDTNKLLSFLAKNDLNVFMYDDMNRGIASVLDYVLAVPRPFGITQSTMFRHVWSFTNEPLVETNTLPGLIDKWTDSRSAFSQDVARLQALWSPWKFVQNYERIIETVCQKV